MAFPTIPSTCFYKFSHFTSVRYMFSTQWCNISLNKDAISLQVKCIDLRHLLVRRMFLWIRAKCEKQNNNM